jgi:hypothetical protein
MSHLSDQGPSPSRINAFLFVFLGSLAAIFVYVCIFHAIPGIKREEEQEKVERERIPGMLAELLSEMRQMRAALEAKNNQDCSNAIRRERNG